MPARTKRVTGCEVSDLREVVCRASGFERNCIVQLGLRVAARLVCEGSRLQPLRVGGERVSCGEELLLKQEQGRDLKSYVCSCRLLYQASILRTRGWWLCNVTLLTTRVSSNVR